MSECKCCDDTTTTITNESLTSPDGSGTFDSILNALENQFQKFYMQDRISGGDLTQMYASMFESALNNSVQFLLGKDTASLQAKLLSKQLILADAEIKIKEKELALKMLEAESKMQEIDLIRKKLLAEIDGIYITNKLTCQKIETEISQISDTDSEGNKIAGLIGSQVAVYKQQIINYTRDNEQKLMKMMLDTWISRKGIDDAVAVPAAIDNQSINGMVDKYSKEIGVDLKIPVSALPAGLALTGSIEEVSVRQAKGLE